MTKVINLNTDEFLIHLGVEKEDFNIWANTSDQYKVMVDRIFKNMNYYEKIFVCDMIDFVPENESFLLLTIGDDDRELVMIDIMLILMDEVEDIYH